MQKLDELIVGDKFKGLEQISEVLKEEIASISRHFMLLCDDVVVRYKKENSKIVFNVEIPASRIKPFGNRLI